MQARSVRGPLNPHRVGIDDRLTAWKRVSGPAGVFQVSAALPAAVNGASVPRSVPRITSRELARKLWHMVPGTLILGLPLVRSFEPFASHMPMVIVFFTAVLGWLSCHYARCFTRPGERDWGTCVWSIAATALIPLIAFPAHWQLSLMAVVLLSLGDGAAALGGQALGGMRWPWNQKKTLAGTLTFVLFAAPAAAWVYWANAEPGVSFSVAFALALAAALFASAVESLPTAINDNIRVGAAAVLSVFTMHWWLGG